MAELSKEQRTLLEQVVARRVGVRSHASELVKAYLDAMSVSAFHRTTDSGSVPTSLTAERSALLIEISRQLGRVIEDFEIQALLRVTAAQARAMRTMLLATYSDDADLLTLKWSLRGATKGPRRKVKEADPQFTGTVFRFTSKDRMDTFVEIVERSGAQVLILKGDPEHPEQVVLSDRFMSDDLPK